MEVEVEMEMEGDDLLFADLTRRISLLIMDDDDDGEIPIVRASSLPLRELTRTVHRVRPGRPPLMADYEHGFVRESKGTGVFIPRRTKQKQRQGSFRTKSENKRLNSQPASTYYFKPKNG